MIVLKDCDNCGKHWYRGFLVNSIKDKNGKTYCEDCAYEHFEGKSER